jgi:hypothetical protein
VVTVAASVLAFAQPAWAHDAPEGSEWVMADWMFGSFVLFLGSGVLVFVVAWRRGLMRDVEMAKYPMLDIIEPDFYDPEWAIDDPPPNESDRAPTRENP